MTALTDAKHSPTAVDALGRRGVILPRPELVVIGPEVALDRIAAGAVLHPFTQLRGERTHIGAGAEIGEGGPAMLEDCWVSAGARIGTMGPVTLRRVTVGPGTVLGSGAAEDAVFIGKEVDDPAISCGMGFRVRKGSLYEEDASSAQHTDTKMTVLFPWVTLGSNVNWCDLLMAGGSGPELGNFSEVGSGAVHFNFTPRGDKATASLLGTVSEGVFLVAQAIFIGGNASLIGPAQAAFGTVTAAGRRFSGPLQPGLHAGEAPAVPEALRPFDPAIYGSIKRVYESQVRFIGELAALDAWYGQARALLAQGDAVLEAVYAAGRSMVRMNIMERIAQLGGMAKRMDRSSARIERNNPTDRRIAQQRALFEAWSGIEVHLQDFAAAQEDMPDALRHGLESSAARHGRIYTRVIRGLDAEAIDEGRAWLAGTAIRLATEDLLARVPSL